MILFTGLGKEDHFLAKPCTNNTQKSNIIQHKKAILSIHFQSDFVIMISKIYPYRVGELLWKIKNGG